MLGLYRFLTKHTEPLFAVILSTRVNNNKEDATRLHERKGNPNVKRPPGKLIWLHAASVGEAQSALILIEKLLSRHPDINILITTGTKTSAQRMENALPQKAFHQFIPLDQPKWIDRYLNHWKPDLAIWLESELWPNTLLAIKKHNIPAALINARLSPRSQKRWNRFQKDFQSIMSCFDFILAQSPKDATAFQNLGISNVTSTGNIKYSAAPLPHIEKDLNALKKATQHRTIILYASTHKGEEKIAAQIHHHLKPKYPNILSIIIPRHPERGETIFNALNGALHCTLRNEEKTLPDESTDIYIANTLGELGLFYRLTNIAYIGRSLSADGGGGHNPLEAAQLNCAIIHGKNIQNLSEIYKDLSKANASICVKDAQDLTQKMDMLLASPDEITKLSKMAYDFSQKQSDVINNVMNNLQPVLNKAGIQEGEKEGTKK